MNKLQELLINPPQDKLIKINGNIYDYVDCNEECVETYRFGKRDYIRAFRWRKETVNHIDFEKESYIAIDSITEISFIEKC